MANLQDTVVNGTLETTSNIYGLRYYVGEPKLVAINYTSSDQGTIQLGSSSSNFLELRSKGEIIFTAYNRSNTSSYQRAEFAYTGSSSTLRPMSNNVTYLGDSAHKWISVYAQNGTIQTSDRASKTDIHYIDAPAPLTRSITSGEKDLTTQDLINFIKKLKPAIFRYGKDGETIEEALNNNKTEEVQLGIIADDIKDEKLFNYIGATMHYIDEENNEDKINLGVKAVPLAVLALAACKYLLEKLE